MNRSDTKRRSMGQIASLSAITLLSFAMLGYGYTFFCGNWKNKGSEVKYFINPNGLDLPVDEQRMLIMDGAETWETQGGALFTSTYQGDTTRKTVAPGDGRSDEFFKSTGNGN